MDNNNLYSIFYMYKKHQQLFLSDAEIAYIQYRDFRIDLLTGIKLDFDLESFIVDIEKVKISNSFEEPIVFHLFYELGYKFINRLDLINQDVPLAIFIKYKKAEIQNIYNNLDKIELSLQSLNRFKFSEYKKKFNSIYDHLKKGNCYQANLTHKFVMRNVEQLNPASIQSCIFSNPLNIGAYSHSTYIHSLGKYFVSNSPECLFQIFEKDNNIKIRTMPIKGTMKSSIGLDSEKSWDKLSASSKDEAELFMITDLMKNDLTKINLRPSKVLKKKARLNAPGIVHQFSLIESTLYKDANLLQVLSSIFPGGSITGAPKKMAVELLNDLEQGPRGFYCGSTLLLYKKIKTASINIRSAEVDYSNNEISYGAGGGITLNSNVQSEFDEVLLKLKSFLLLLNN